MDEQFAQKLFDECPVRFKRAEKNKFLLLVRGKFHELGYESNQIRTLKQGSSRNFVVGKPDAKYVFTAHYDTPGRTGFLLFSAPLFGQTGGNLVYIVLMVLLFLLAEMGGIKLMDYISDIYTQGPASIILPLLACIFPILIGLAVLFIPIFVKNKNNRNDNTSGVLGVLALAEIIAKDKVMKENSCFVLFDNEEWGLIGSAKYSAWLKNNGCDISRATVINLDCVGVGDRLAVVSTSRRNKLAKYLKNALTEKGEKVSRKTSIMIYMSDHASLRGAVMIARVRRAVFGPLYIPNIHTRKDKECDLQAVEKLAADLYDITSSIE